MKALILTALILVFSFDAASQYARSFYATSSTTRRHSIALNNGSTTHVLSIRNSSGDTLRATIIDIDDFGNTSNYRQFEYSPFNVSSSFQLSGAGISANGNLTLCVLSPASSGTVNVGYITLDPVTGNFSNANSLLGQYRQGFSRTQMKGDNLITYLADANGNAGINRVSASMATGNVTTEMVDPTLTYSQSMSINRLNGELIIDGNDEYFALSNAVIKRTGANTYMQSPLNAATIFAPNIALNSSGELFVLKINGQYELYDNNLSPISTGTLGTSELVSVVTTEMYALPNGGYRILTNRSGKYVRIDVDANFAVIEQEKQKMNFQPTGQTTFNGKRYISGYSLGYPSLTDIDGNVFQSSPSSINLLCDDLTGSVDSFLEYDRKIITGNLEFQVNHLGMSFNGEMVNSNLSSQLSGGLSYNLNGRSVSTIFTSSSTIAGKSLTGDTIGALVTYKAKSVAGPYCNPGSYNHEVMDKYSRGYYVSREMIDAHIYGISSADPNYVIPFGIKEWPAHGDVNLGQASNLAAFVDLNSNGIYEPQSGDYPSIYGDICVLTIFHQHPNTPSSASIETHQYTFIFKCDQDEAIENTVFVRTDNFARAESLTDAYIGIFTDIDIGNPFDDYSGTNVELGMIYGYNGDSNDETTPINEGFGDTIPASGILILQGMKLNETGVDVPFGVNFGESINGVGFGDGIPDNEYFTLESSIVTFTSLNLPTEPNDLASLYTSMRGLNGDGTPKIVNGVTVYHTYFGNSDPLFYSSHGVDHGNNHSEITEGNSPEDRRLHCASGPADFEMGDTLTLVNAYLAAIDTVNLSPVNSLTKLFEHGATIKNFYAQNTDACGNNFNPFISDLTLSTPTYGIAQILLYPNPTSASFKVKGITGSANVQIFDLNGRLVAEETNFKDGQEISIQNLDNAVYLVSVEDEIGKQVIRLVKR